MASAKYAQKGNRLVGRLGVWTRLFVDRRAFRQIRFRSPTYSNVIHRFRGTTDRPRVYLKNRL